VRQYVDELRKRYPQGAIMLDIHGQGADTRAIYRGTRNGATVKQLIKRHGTPALTGPQSILGFLESKGYKVIPASGAPGNPLEDRRFNGGYIVGTYGSHREEGIDAIQLEFGRTLRTRAATAGDLAEAIAVFYRAYLAADAPGGEHAPPGAARPAGYLGLRAYFAGRASIERSILWNLKSLGAGL